MNSVFIISLDDWDIEVVEIFVIFCKIVTISYFGEVEAYLYIVENILLFSEIIEDNLGSVERDEEFLIKVFVDISGNDEIVNFCSVEKVVVESIKNVVGVSGNVGIIVLFVEKIDVIFDSFETSFALN